MPNQEYMDVDDEAVGVMETLMSGVVTEEMDVGLDNVIRDEASEDHMMHCDPVSDLVCSLYLI